ncbi:MAG: hypothetical protein IKN54_06935 [Lachnospiraceae bacterium]|nr:hypothetical protein [Lachnospiraceae bacterium]
MKKQKVINYLYWLAHMYILAITVMIGTYLACEENRQIGTGFMIRIMYIDLQQYLTTTLITMLIFASYWSTQVRDHLLMVWDNKKAIRIMTIIIMLLFEALYLMLCLISMTYAGVGLFTYTINMPVKMVIAFSIFYVAYPVGDLIVYNMKKNSKKSKVDTEVEGETEEKL